MCGHGPEGNVGLHLVQGMAVVQSKLSALEGCSMEAMVAHTPVS